MVLVSLVPEYRQSASPFLKKSKVRAKSREVVDHQQSQRGNRGDHLLMFQDPRVSVRHEYRINASAQGRIDVRFTADANQPGHFRGQIVFGDDLSIGWNILFRYDLDRRKKALQAG